VRRDVGSRRRISTIFDCRDSILAGWRFLEQGFRFSLDAFGRVDAKFMGQATKFPARKEMFFSNHISL
jgi:hypothetical protein